MKAMDILRIAHHQFFEEFIPENVKNTYSFTEHFDYVIRSFVTLAVGWRFISGTQGIEFNSKKLISSHFAHLERAIVDDGFWLWVYVGDLGQFDLVNFKDAIALDRMYSELSEERSVTAIIKIRR